MRIIEDGIKTGYPHIDQPWMKFYDRLPINTIDPKTNITEYLKQKNMDRMQRIAETYYGLNKTYEEYFEDSEIAATILSEIGVKKGDNIIYLMPNLPETSRIWQGAISIGASSDFVDPRPDSPDILANAKKILEIIKREKAKYIVSLDKCYLGMLKPIEDLLKDLGINKVILVSPSDSMNLKGKLDYLDDVINYNNLRNKKISNNIQNKKKTYQIILEKLKEMKNEEKVLDEAIKNSKLEILKYKDLVNECERIKYSKDTDPDTITYIGHTSGTSGNRPKPITITNKNAISTLEQLEKSNISFPVGSKVLNNLPFFAPFGVFDNHLLNFSSGCNNIYIPEFDISEFGYLLKKHHPNIVVGVPSWFASLPKYEYLENEDLSCIQKIIYGGDSMSPKDEEILCKWLKQHGSVAEIEKGHGMSEYCGCGSYAQKSYNNFGSIGIPMTNTIYTIVDPNIEDKLVPLKFEDNEDRLQGELVVSSDAVTNGMLYDEEIVPHYEMDGKSYIRTRDIVEMDRDGIFYHNARKDRSFVRYDGYKYKPYEVEKEIMNNENIRDIRIVEYYDEDKHGIMPIAHIVIKDNYNGSYKDLVKEIVYEQIIGNRDMTSRQIPTKFRIRESLPLTANGKVNTKFLIEEGLNGSEISVNVIETNLTIENIEIIDNKNMELKLKK